MGGEEKDVVIVGAGLAGLATALALKRVGVRSMVVLERAPELRATGASLTLFHNAWIALRALGVADKLMPLYSVFPKGYVTNIATGACHEMCIGTTERDEMGVRAVHRKVLLDVLAEELPPGTIRFSSRLASIKSEIMEGEESTNTLYLEDGGIIKAKVVIGCDGVHSVVAKWLGLTAPINSGRSAVRGLAVYPEGHRLEQAIQQFLGDGKRSGFVPLNDKEVFWYITQWSTPGEQWLAKEAPEVVLQHVMENMVKDLPSKFLDVVQHSDASAVSWTPILFRVPWDLIVGKTPNKGGVTVTGDAMHPMTPDLAQGGCMALEDAVVLGRNLAKSLQLDGSIEMNKVAKVLENYAKERRWRAAGLITGAYLSGWVQQCGTGWQARVKAFFRDQVFYKILYPWIMNAAHYDCGTLSPQVAFE